MGCSLIAGNGLGACTGSCPANQQCTCTDPVDGGGCAGCGCTNCGGSPSVCGDPHFTGLHGESYNIQGEPNKYYNILTDIDIQVNSLFTSYCEKWVANATVLGMVSIKVDSMQISISNRHEVSVNAQFLDPLSFPMNISFGDAVLYVSDAEDITFFNREYEIAVQIVDNHRKAWSPSCTFILIDVGITILDKTRKPHGLLGQTSTHTHPVVSNHQVGGNNGQGEIEGIYKDYEVSGLFGDDFKFNKFSL